jgi:hypothetical protein
VCGASIQTDGQSSSATRKAAALAKRLSEQLSHSTAFSLSFRLATLWQAVQFLLRHGASASLRDNEQATALHYAALAGNEFACRELLLQGAQSAALAVRAFEQRQTPEELAEAYGHPHLASFLHRWKKQSNGVWKSAAQPQTTFMRWHNDAHMFA